MDRRTFINRFGSTTAALAALPVAAFAGGAVLFAAIRAQDFALYFTL